MFTFRIAKYDWGLLGHEFRVSMFQKGHYTPYCQKSFDSYSEAKQYAENFSTSEVTIIDEC